MAATPLVPIGSSTLVYGSDDGGRSVQTRDPVFSQRLEPALARLKLKPHLVGREENELKLIRGPIDLEGHLGRDGRYYLCDVARLFPPEAPQPTLGAGQIFYNLLREELLSRLPNELSSDAFSAFGRHGAPEHNQEVYMGEM